MWRRSSGGWGYRIYPFRASTSFPLLWMREDRLMKINACGKQISSAAASGSNTVKMQQRHRTSQAARPSRLWSVEAGVMRLCTASRASRVGSPHLQRGWRRIGHAEPSEEGFLRIKRLEKVRAACRTKHNSLRTQMTALGWIKPFVHFHGTRRQKPSVRPAYLGKSRRTVLLKDSVQTGQEVSLANGPLLQTDHVEAGR